MRLKIISLVLFAACFQANAQQALINFESGDSTEAYITSIDSTTIFTSDTSYFLTNIEKVTFKKNRGRDIHLYYELGNAGVEVNFDDEVRLSPMNTSQIELQRDPLSQLKTGLNQYRKAHQIGAGLQLAGVVLGITGILFDSDGMATVGLGVAAGGLIYELTASQHLKHLEY